MDKIENKESEKTEKKELRTVTKHTWIGEEEDIRIATRDTLPGINRKTLQGGDKETLAEIDSRVERRSLSWDETRARNGDPGAIYGATRIVEKTKKPYEGFINNKQVEESEKAVHIEDRSTRILSPDDRAELFKMKVYPYPKSGTENSSNAASSEVKAKRGKKSVLISDLSKFKRFIAIIVIACVLLAADVTLLVLKAKTAAMPSETENIIEQTTNLEEENARISKESAEYGDYEEQKELKASWERLKETLTGGKSE